jgi:hypothetical protein
MADHLAYRGHERGWGVGERVARQVPAARGGGLGDAEDGGGLVLGEVGVRQGAPRSTDPSRHSALGHPPGRAIAVAL